MNPLLDQFLLEARELVETAGDELLQLERRPDDAVLIDSVFRAFHTLKGSADIIGLPAMSLALHAGEDVLAGLRAGNASCTAAVADAALALLGQVGDWLDAIERDGDLPPDASTVADRLAMRLREAFAGEGAAGDRSASPPPEWVAPFLNDPSIRSAARAGALIAVDYDPLPRAFFNGDDPLDLVRGLTGLLAVDIRPRRPWPDIAVLDPFESNLSIHVLAACDAGAAAAHFRLVGDQIRIVRIEAAPEPDAGGDFTDAILAEQVRLLRSDAAPGTLSGRIAAAGRAAANVLRYAGAGGVADRVEAAAAQALASGEPELLAAAVSAAMAPAAETAAEARAADRVLRVDAAEIDALADLTGELVIAKNGLGHLIGRAEAGMEPADLLRALRAEHAALERLSTAMHTSVMQVRLLPVAQMFRRFPRLVRDIAQELGKDVAFVTSGEETRADKAIIEKLHEPLIHILRNALDHGCDTPDERRAAGKPARATLSLRAARDGEAIVIEVADDGRGIDAEAVRRTAIGRGLMSEEAAAELSPEETIQLVFLPGFSTAAEVSRLSGRGVGMDAVRTAIERIGGRVALSSTPGAGTTVRMTLPLSLVLVRIMIVRVGDEVFGILLDSVVETTRVAREQLVPIRDSRALVLRERTLPVVRLCDLLGLPETSEAAEARILVASTESGPVGIEVDGFGERMEAVMKPLDGLLAGMPNLLGTTLTGDGRVLLVLDLKGLIR